MDFAMKREILKPIKIGSKIAKNRIALSPMGVNLENADGSISAAAFEYFAARACGGAGIIFTGSANVTNPAGRSVPTHLRLDKADYIPGWSRLAEEVHRYDSLIIVQLMHAGNSAVPVYLNGHQPESASELSNIGGGKCRELSTDEVKHLVNSFVMAAVYAKTAGVDGVEIHGAHAYLINDFLSPATNHRTDEYGGNIESRARFALEIIGGIKAACGPDFICGIRLGIEESLPGGYGREEGLALAKMMVAAGADYISASIGHTVMGDTRLVETHKHAEGDRVYLAEAVKQVVNVPVFTTGKLRDPDYMDALILDGKADVMCLGRPLICDPNWVNKVSVGDFAHIRPCINCLEGCIIKVAMGEALQCAVNPIVGKEYRFKGNTIASEKKKVVVIGGGVAGMEAARVAAIRGHRVTLFEKADKLGGQVNYAKQPPHKERMGLIIGWYTQVLPELGVDIRLGKEPNVNDILAEKPDSIIMATGAAPVMDKLESTEPLIRPWDILEGKVALDGINTVAILGGGMVGCETAEYLASKGKDVTVFEMLSVIGNGAAPLNQLDMMMFFASGAAKSKVSTKIKYVDSEGVHYENETEGEQCMKADMYVCAVGQRSNIPCLASELEAQNITVRYVGDAKNVSKVFYAIRDGFYAGYDA